ncbi:MAG: hypothetical protein NT029_19805 [Armatimonadetes bacterium]|nr:hypothetical protein [Armatimonadota bacterium]
MRCWRCGTQMRQVPPEVAEGADEQTAPDAGWVCDECQGQSERAGEVCPTCGKPAIRDPKFKTRSECAKQRCSGCRAYVLTPPDTAESTEARILATFADPARRSWDWGCTDCITCAACGEPLGLTEVACVRRYTNEAMGSSAWLTRFGTGWFSYFHRACIRCIECGEKLTLDPCLPIVIKSVGEGGHTTVAHKSCIRQAAGGGPSDGSGSRSHRRHRRGSSRRSGSSRPAAVEPDGAAPPDEAGEETRKHSHSHHRRSHSHGAGASVWGNEGHKPGFCARCGYPLGLLDKLLGRKVHRVCDYR